MTACEIDYSELESAVSNVRKAKEELYDCMDFLSVKVMGKLNSLPGSDEFGNIASVQSSISTKVGTMRSKQNVLEDFVYDVDHFASMAADADQRVADRISELAEPHKEAWSFTEAWRSVTGFFYNVFCVDIPNFLGDRSPFFEGIIEFLREKANSVSHWMDDVGNYFKYGEGQYKMNTIESALAFAGTVISVVGVVTLAIVNSLVILAGAAIILGAIVLVYSFMNCAASCANNKMANDYLKDGRKDLAHYYGSTESLVHWAEKSDFGDADVNLKWDTAIGIFDTVGKTAEFGLDLIKIAVGALSMGNLYGGVDGKEVIGKDYSMENIKKNSIEEAKKIFMKSGVKDDSVKINSEGKFVKFEEYEIDPVEFIFNNEVHNVKDLSGDDSLKRYKVVKKGVDWTVDVLTGEKTGYAKLAEKFDELHEDFSYTGVLDIFSEAFSLIGVGPARMADEYISPSSKLLKKFFELLPPEPA